MAARLFPFLAAGIPCRLEPCRCGTPAPALPAGRKAGLPGRLFRAMKRPVWGRRTACSAPSDRPFRNALAARQLAWAGVAAADGAETPTPAMPPPARKGCGRFACIHVCASLSQWVGGAGPPLAGAQGPAPPRASIVSRAAAASMPPAANKFGVFFAVYDNFIIFAYPKRQGTLPLRPSKANKTIRLCRQTVTCRCLCTTRQRSTATAKP